MARCCVVLQNLATGEDARRPAERFAAGKFFTIAMSRADAAFRIAILP
jgi:hypothetical protein